MVKNLLDTVKYDVGTPTALQTDFPIPFYQPYPANCATGNFSYKLSYLDQPTA